MHCWCLLAILFFVMPIGGQVREIVSPLQPFKDIAEKLRRAKASKSIRTKRQALFEAQNLVKRLPPSAVAEGLRVRLQRAFEAGIATFEAEKAIDEAIDIASMAEKLIGQRPSISDHELARQKLLQVLNSPEFRSRTLLLSLLRRISKWLEKPINWALRQLRRFANFVGKFLGPFLEWLAKVLQALGMWFWHWFRFLMEISPVLAWGTVGVLGAIVAVSLAYSVWKRWLKRQKEVAKEVAVQALVMPEQLLREAEIAAREGDYLTALRKAYRALLLVLDFIGLVRFREQKTNWEYLAEVSRKAPSDFILRFQEATNIFDLCFYARKLATETDFATVKQLAEETSHRARSLSETMPINLG